MYSIGGDTMAPSGLYARLCHAFCSLFLFLIIARKQIISGSAGPILTVFAPNDTYLFVDDRSGPFFIP